MNYRTLEREKIKTEIVRLTETKLPKEDIFIFRDYNVWRENKLDGRGGVIIAQEGEDKGGYVQAKRKW